MKPEQLMQIFSDTAYVRMCGSEAEYKAAQYLVDKASGFGGNVVCESFPVDMANVELARLTVDGEEIPCTGYRGSGNAELEAPLYYLRNRDPWSLKQCRGKIVLLDGYIGYWLYQDLLENGALGFITYGGDVHYADCDIEDRELRSYVHKGNRIPGMHVNVKTAIPLIKRGAKTAKIELRQEEYEGESHNVILELPGKTGQFITLTAHYDSVSLSQGAYDNMSGSVGLLGIAQALAGKEHNYGLRFIWFGGEERGLLGSKAYCAAHEEQLKDTVLNINLDMIGSIMGKFIYCATAEDRLCHYIEYFSAEMGFGIDGKQGVYSSDSTPFADHGVPSVSFARLAPHSTATIHNRYDTAEILSAEQLTKDIAFLTAFTERMTDAAVCPVKRDIPENMKEKLDEYLARKRPTKG